MSKIPKFVKENSIYVAIKYMGNKRHTGVILLEKGIGNDDLNRSKIKSLFRKVQRTIDFINKEIDLKNIKK